MTKIKLAALYCAFALTGCVGVHSNSLESKSANDPQPNQATWIQLFNGKDLSGWTPKFKGHQAGVNYKNTFKVETASSKSTTASTTNSTANSVTCSGSRSCRTTAFGRNIVSSANSSLALRAGAFAITAS